MLTYFAHTAFLTQSRYSSAVTPNHLEMLSVWTYTPASSVRITSTLTSRELVQSNKHLWVAHTEYWGPCCPCLERQLLHYVLTVKTNEVVWTPDSNAKIWNPDAPITSWMTSDRLLNLSEPLFPDLSKGEIKLSCRVLVVSVTNRRHLAQGVASRNVYCVMMSIARHFRYLILVDPC